MKNLLLILVILITGITNAQECNLNLYDSCPEFTIDFTCSYDEEKTEIRSIIDEFFTDMLAHNANTYEGKPPTRVSDDINDYDIHVDFYSFGRTDIAGETVHCQKTGDKVLVDITINADTWALFNEDNRYSDLVTSSTPVFGNSFDNAYPALKKKWLVYHELGHAVLKLNHICKINAIMSAPGCTRSGGDILKFPSGFYEALTEGNSLFQQKLTQMFTGTDQEYSSCTDGVITETTSSSTSSSSSSAAATYPSQSSAGAQSQAPREYYEGETIEEYYGDTDLTNDQLQNRIDAIDDIDKPETMTTKYGWETLNQVYFIQLTDITFNPIKSEVHDVANLTTLTYSEFEDLVDWTIEWRNAFLSKIADNHLD